MTSISRLVAVIKEDVNNEESIILEAYSRYLNAIFKMILWLGIPFFIYLMIQFGQQF